MDIIQSCLFTILICTWSVQHLNVPPPRDGRVEILKRKIWWMTVTVLFPEFILAHAIMERDMAFKSMRHLKGLDKILVHDRPWWKACLEKFSRLSCRKDSSEPITVKTAEKESNSRYELEIRTPPNKDRLSRAFFPSSDIEANSSKLSIQSAPVKSNFDPRSSIRAFHSHSVPSFSEKEDGLFWASFPKPDIEANPSKLSIRSVQNTSANSTSQPDDFKGPIPWTLIHSYYANMGGLRLTFPKDLSFGRPITTEQVSILLKKGHIAVDDLRDLSIDSIVDKSKGDFFTKGLAIVQVLWLVITLLIRGSRHLAVTQLEILAIAFAICSILTYGFWWNKPQDVRSAIRIRGCSHCVDQTEHHYDSVSREMANTQPDSITRELLSPFSNKNNIFWNYSIRNDNFELSEGSIQPVGIVLALSTVS